MNAFNHSLMATVGFVLISVHGCAFANSPPDFTGKYNCTYHDLGSNTNIYTETLTIKKNGNVYNVQIYAPGTLIPSELGTGIVNTDVNNAFSYVFWNLKDATTFGSELFVIKPDGSLDGVFSYSNNNNKPGVETCTKAS